MTSDIHFDSLNPWTPRPVVGTVTKVDNGYLININGAVNAYYGEQEFSTQFKKTKQECWDCLQRNFRNQIFHWNV